MELGDSREAAGPDGSVRRGGVVMDTWERQDVFREMVAGVLRNGELTVRRRRQLVAYAASLGISAVQAGRLVSQARHLHKERCMAAPGPVLSFGRTGRHVTAPPWVQMAAVAIAGLIVSGLALLLARTIH